ncbi:MAG: hypothetical protein R6T85_12030 [Egibacteraceae bacterium]
MLAQPLADARAEREEESTGVALLGDRRGEQGGLRAEGALLEQGVEHPPASS